MKLSTKKYQKAINHINTKRKQWIAKWYPNSHSSTITRMDIAKRFDCSVDNVDRLIAQCKKEGLI